MLRSEIRKQREAKILSQLAKLGISSVYELMKLNAGNLGHGGRMNALRVLNEMENKGLVDSVQKERKLFCVKGRGFGHWEHRLMMNKFLIKKGLLHKAKIEPTITLNGIKFRPDFVIPIKNDPTKPTDYIYYEVDNRQKKKVNMDKIERYKKLNLRFEVVCTAERKNMWKGCVIHEC